MQIPENGRMSLIGRPVKARRLPTSGDDVDLLGPYRSPPAKGRVKVRVKVVSVGHILNGAPMFTVKWNGPAPGQQKQVNMRLDMPQIHAWAIVNPLANKLKTPTIRRVILKSRHLDIAKHARETAEQSGFRELFRCSSGAMFVKELHIQPFFIHNDLNLTREDLVKHLELAHSSTSIALAVSTVSTNPTACDGLHVRLVKICRLLDIEENNSIPELTTRAYHRVLARPVPKEDSLQCSVEKLSKALWGSRCVRGFW
jgi:hypothetical protein